MSDKAKVINDEMIQKHQNNYQDNWRDIDATEIGQERADRAQRRLGDPVKEIADHRDAPVVPVDYAESQEPTQHGLADEQVDVQPNERMD
jgi:hypothetical protein